MNKSTIGVILALLFVTFEAVQTVYFGGLFQRMSTFVFGALVFGLIFVLFVGWTAWRTPHVIRIALANPLPLLGVNLCAVMTFSCFLMSVQLIEPAITYTVSAGTMPIATWALHRLGIRGGENMRNRFETAGTLLLLVSIVFLSVATIAGASGFVRGDIWTATAGIVLAMLDGTFFTLIIVFSQRLGAIGIGPTAIMGLRLPLYVLFAGSLATMGVDAKDPLTAAEIAFFVTIGFLLTTPPLWLMQKAVELISTLTISSLTALGPFFIFAMQLFEGRVDYATATLIGISIYAVASLLAAYGAVQASVGKPA